MAGLTVGLVRETAVGERRVALTPDGVRRLRRLGLRVVVESGAGAAAWFDDADYAAAGARLTDAEAVCADSDIVVCVRAPEGARRAALGPGQVLVGLLRTRTDPALVADLAAASVTALDLDGLPRTLSSAQSMDALTSQANVAGYKAALVAADAYAGYFPLLMTAAGTVRPARVLVLGAGVAGLQAIGTARRLGAVVTGYDVRAAARADVASTGAAFLQVGLQLGLEPGAAGSDPGPAGSGLGPASGTGGGYARELTAAEQDAQQAALVRAVATFDVVITTAQVPGRRPPVLLPAAAVAALHRGAVVVDLAAGPLGGNVEGSVPDRTVVTAAGVTVVGAGNLPSAVPQAASTAYSRNTCALLAHLVPAGVLVLDPADAITAGILVGPADGAAPDRRTDLAPSLCELGPEPDRDFDREPELHAAGAGRHR